MLRALESWLRIDRSGTPGSITRSRAVYAIAAVMSALQFVNLALVLYEYQRWSLDASIALSAAVIIGLSTCALRWTKNFMGFAVFYSILTTAAVTGSALPSGMGIHTSLLPIICIGPMIIGYIFDWRAAISYGLVGTGMLIVLYSYTLSHPDPLIGPANMWGYQRFVQAEMALILGTVVAVNFSYNTYNSLNDLQRSLDRTQKAETAKSDFLATMSHELRTPLNGVIGMSEALCASDLQPREREMAATIKRSGESLLVIIGDLLDLAKIEAGKLVVEKEFFSPHQLVQHTVESWRAAAELKGVEITAEHGEGTTDPLVGDEHRIGQILHNLVSNAVKFTDSGDITIAAAIEPDRDGERLVFRVSDTGRGIPEDMREQIFEPFEQGENGTTRRFGGTGLGLPICRKLAVLMNGQIALEPSSGPGSTFVLTLPMERGEAVTSDEQAQTLRPSSLLQGTRVLVAEDNEVNRMVMREFLTAWGCEPVFAHDGLSALEALEHDRFDIFLLDKHMPGLSGPDVALKVRASGKAYRAVPIIAVSADTLPGERDEALAVGMDDYVPKPVRPAVLRKAMEDLLVSDRAAREELERSARPSPPRSAG